MSGLRNYDARARLAEALADIFAERGKFADVINAVCSAQRELAAQNRDLVTVQGWIVGKKD